MLHRNWKPGTETESAAAHTGRSNRVILSTVNPGSVGEDVEVGVTSDEPHAAEQVLAAGQAK